MDDRQKLIDEMKDRTIEVLRDSLDKAQRIIDMQKEMIEMLENLLKKKG
jgi:hypothetical protein